MLAHTNGFGEKGIGSCVSVEAFVEIALYFRLYRIDTRVEARLPKPDVQSFREQLQSSEFVPYE